MTPDFISISEAAANFLKGEVKSREDEFLSAFNEHITTCATEDKKATFNLGLRIEIKPEEEEFKMTLGYQIRRVSTETQSLPQN